MAAIGTLTTLKKRDSENIVGKGENAGYQHFLLFPTMFYKGHFRNIHSRRSLDMWCTY